MMSSKRTSLMVKIFFLLLGLGTSIAACATPLVATQEPEPTPEVDRLAAPYLPNNPTQADLGAQVYYQVCMACHGDKGQGLTEEWRVIWKEDYNCWQSECHGNDHPPHGFSFPQTCCKAVIGPTTLATYETAQDLFTYTYETMPWWNPGYMPIEDFWQVTNFLMRQNGAIPDGIVLDATNAFAFNVHPGSPLPDGDEKNQALLVSGVLMTAASILALQKTKKS